MMKKYILLTLLAVAACATKNLEHMRMTPGTVIQMKMWGLKYGRAISAHNDNAAIAARAFQDALDAYANALKQDKLTVTFEPGPAAERAFRLLELKKACIDAYLEFLRTYTNSLERFEDLQKGLYRLPEG